MGATHSQHVQKSDTTACSHAGSIPELYGSLRTMRRFVIGMLHGTPSGKGSTLVQTFVTPPYVQQLLCFVLIPSF